MHDSRIMWFYSVFGVTVIKSHLCVYSYVFYLTSLTFSSYKTYKIKNGKMGVHQLSPALIRRKKERWLTIVKSILCIVRTLVAQYNRTSNNYNIFKH